jgi:hypothetical protein
MSHVYVITLVRQIECFSDVACERSWRKVASAVCSLWKRFVDLSKTLRLYTHRKDRRCFVVALLFSLPTGLTAPGGVIVEAHDWLVLPNLNKKKKYSAFCVSDIRHGQKMIMRTFSAPRAVPHEGALRLSRPEIEMV